MRLVIIILFIFIVISLFFVLDSISPTDQGTGGTGTAASSTGTGGTGTAASSTGTGGTGTAASSNGAGRTGTVASSNGAGRTVSTTSPTGISVQKYMEPLKPQKRKEIQIILTVLSNQNDISSVTLEDVIPSGFEFKSADPSYSQIINSTANKDGKIKWTYKCSGDYYRTSNEFRYILTANKRIDKELMAATLTAWDKNSKKLQPIESNTIICSIPNEPPYFEIPPKSPLRIFKEGIYNIRAVVKDPENDNFTCLLIADDKPIEPNEINTNINEYSWDINLGTERKQVYIIAKDEEGAESEVKAVEIIPLLDLSEDLNAISVLIGAILGSIFTIFGTILTNNKSKSNILLREPTIELSESTNKIVEQELGQISEAIKKIGQANACMTPDMIQGAKKSLSDNGYEGARDYAARLIGTDQNTELLRVLLICENSNLSPESATFILDKLDMLESGKW
jgi:hypothetical protein